MQTAPFNQPGVVEVSPGRYEAHLVAGIWFFNPLEIRVPEGSEVTFVATSKDVIHGLLVANNRYPMEIVSQLDVFRAVLPFDAGALYAPLLEEIEERRRAQQSVALDAWPAPRLSHVVQARIVIGKLLGRDTEQGGRNGPTSTGRPRYHRRRSIMLR